MRKQKNLLEGFFKLGESLKIVKKKVDEANVVPKNLPLPERSHSVQQERCTKIIYCVSLGRVVSMYFSLFMMEKIRTTYIRFAQEERDIGNEEEAMKWIAASESLEVRQIKVEEKNES